MRDTTPGRPADQPTYEEPVIDLDLPVELDEESLSRLDAETQRFVFNVLFVAMAVVVVIVWFASR